MAKKLNYALIGLFAIFSCFLGLISEDLSVALDGTDILFLIVGTILFPSILVVSNDVLPLANDLRAPDLGKWSLNPWQPLRFSLLFGCLCLSVGVPGSVSVLIAQGLSPNLSFPIAFLVAGIGLIIGCVIATRKFQDKLIPEES